jgi:biotin carboxylase
MQPERVLVIGGKKKLLMRAKELGIETVYVQKAASYDPTVGRHAGKVVLADYEAEETFLPLVQQIFEERPFHCAISMSENALLPCARINDKYQLAGTSWEAARRLKDKWAMRCKLNKLGLGVVAARQGSSLDEMEQFFEAHGGPLIVKPVDGTASLGIFKVFESCDVKKAWDGLQEAGISRFIAEELLEGPEVSVESFSFNSRHVVLAITDKVILENFVECGHSMPAAIDPATGKAIGDTVSLFLDAMGLKDGPAHTELKLTARGPLVIESHNRVGGDKISDLVELVYGIDMVGLALAWACGMAQPLTGPPSPRGGAAVRFFIPPPGMLQKISGEEEVRVRPEVVELVVSAKTRERIPAVRTSRDRSGHLIVKSKDAAQAIACCERLAKEIHFEVA